MYLRDGSAQTIVRAAKLRQKLQIKLATSPSHSIRPAWQGSHWSAKIFKSGIDSTPKNSRHERDSNPGSFALEADSLTTRPTRRSSKQKRCLAVYSMPVLGSRPSVRDVSAQRIGRLFVGCLTSQQHASVSQGRICTDNFTCCHTEIEAADQTFHLTQS